MDERRRLGGHPGRDYDVDHQFHHEHMSYNDRMMERDRYQHFMSRTSRPPSGYHGGVPYYGNQGGQGSPYSNWQGRARDPSHARNMYHPQVFPNCYGQTNIPSGQTAGQLSHFGYERFGGAVDGIPMHGTHSLPRGFGAHDSRQGFWNTEMYSSSQARIQDSRGYPPCYDTPGGNAGFASSQVHHGIKSNISSTNSDVPVRDRTIRDSHNTESNRGNLPLNYEAGGVSSGHQLQLDSSRSEVLMPSVSSQSHSEDVQGSNLRPSGNDPLQYSTSNHIGGESLLPVYIKQEDVPPDNCEQHFQTNNVPDTGGKTAESHFPSKHSSKSVHGKPSSSSLQGRGNCLVDVHDQVENPVDQVSLNVNRKKPPTSYKSSDHPVKIPQAKLKNHNISPEKMFTAYGSEHQTKMKTQDYGVKNFPEISKVRDEESDSQVSLLHNSGDCSAQVADTRHEVNNQPEEAASLQGKHRTPTESCNDRRDVKEAVVPKKTPPKSVRTTVDLSASELGCSTMIQFKGGTCKYIKGEHTSEKEEGTTFYCSSQHDVATESEPRVGSPRENSPSEIQEDYLPIVMQKPQIKQYHLHDDVSKRELQTTDEVMCWPKKGDDDIQSLKELTDVSDASRHIAVPVAIQEHSIVMHCSDDIDALQLEAENQDFNNSSNFSTGHGPNDDGMFDRCPSCSELVASDDMIEHSFKCKVAKPDLDEAPENLPFEPPNDDEAAMNCPECGVGFQTTDDLVIHLRIHEMLAKNAKKIQEADQMMLMTEEMEKQMTEIAGDVTETQPEECDVCYEVFTDPTMIPYHKMMHQQFPFHCRKCNLFFSTLTELYKSRCADQKRHKVFKYRCEKCKGALLDSYKMRKHRKRCEGKMETCRVCQEKFPSFRQLAQHAEIYHNEKMNNIGKDGGEISETNVDKAVSENENTDLQDGTAQGDKAAVHSSQGDEHADHRSEDHQTSNPTTSDSTQAKQDLLPHDTGLEIKSDREAVKDEIIKTTYQNEHVPSEGPGKIKEPENAIEAKNKPSEYSGVAVCKICGKELPMSHRYHGRACKEIPEYCKTCSKTGRAKKLPSESSASDKDPSQIRTISDSTLKEDTCENITSEPLKKKIKIGETCGACGKWFKNFSKLEKHAGKCDGIKKQKDRGVCQDSPKQCDEINLNLKYPTTHRNHGRASKEIPECCKTSSKKLLSEHSASEKEPSQKRTLSDSASKEDTYENINSEPLKKKCKNGETCGACGKWFKNFSKLEKHAGKCDGVKKQKDRGVCQDSPKQCDEINLNLKYPTTHTNHERASKEIPEYRNTCSKTGRTKKLPSESSASETEPSQKRTVSDSTSREDACENITSEPLKKKCKKDQPDGETCGACGKWFKNFSKLEMHAGKCDGVKKKKDRGVCQDSPQQCDEINLNWKYPPTYKCPNCKQMFSKEKKLKKHVKTCLWIQETTSSEPVVRSNAVIDEVSDPEDELPLSALKNTDDADADDTVRKTNADDVVDDSLVSSPVESVERPIEDNRIEPMPATETNQQTMNKEESDEITCDIAVAECNQETVEMQVPDKIIHDMAVAEVDQEQEVRDEPSESISVTESNPETMDIEDPDESIHDTPVTKVDHDTMDMGESNETEGNQETLDREESKETKVNQEALEREESNESIQDISIQCATYGIVPSHQSRTLVTETILVQNTGAPCNPASSSGPVHEDLPAESSNDCDTHNAKSEGLVHRVEISQTSNDDEDTESADPSPASKQLANCSRMEIVDSVSEPAIEVLGPDATDARDTSSDDMLQEHSPEGNSLQLSSGENMKPHHLSSLDCPMTDEPLLKADENTEMEITNSAHCTTEEIRHPEAYLSSPLPPGGDVENITPHHLSSGDCPMTNIPDQLLKADKNTEMDIMDSAHCTTEKMEHPEAELSSPSPPGGDVKRESHLAEESYSACPEVNEGETTTRGEEMEDLVCNKINEDKESVDQSVDNSSEPEQASRAAGDIGVADDTESLSLVHIVAGQPLRKSLEDDDNTMSSVSQTQGMSTSAPTPQEPAQTVSRESSLNTNKGSIEVMTGIEEKGHFSGINDKSGTGSPLEVEYTMGLEAANTVSLECETILAHHCVYCAAQFPSRNDLWNHARECRDNHLMVIANRVTGETKPIKSTKPSYVIEPVVLEKVPWQVQNDYTKKEAMVMKTEIGIDLNCVLPTVGYKHPPNKPFPQTTKHKKKKKKKKSKIKEDVEMEKRRMIERKKRRERDVQREKIRVQAKLQQLEQKKIKRTKNKEQQGSFTGELCNRSFHSIERIEEHKVSHVTTPLKKALTVCVEKLKMGEIIGSEKSKSSTKHSGPVKLKEKESSKKKHYKVPESKFITEKSAKRRPLKEEDAYVDVVSLEETPPKMKNPAKEVLKGTEKPDNPVTAVGTPRTATGNVKDIEQVVDSGISHGNSKATVWKKNEFCVQFPVVIEVECPDCQMKFSHQSTLDRHRRLHRK